MDINYVYFYFFLFFSQPLIFLGMRTNQDRVCFFICVYTLLSTLASFGYTWNKKLTNSYLPPKSCFWIQDFYQILQDFKITNNTRKYKCIFPISHFLSKRSEFPNTSDLLPVQLFISTRTTATELFLVLLTNILTTSVIQGKLQPFTGWRCTWSHILINSWSGSDWSQWQNCLWIQQSRIRT